MEKWVGPSAKDSWTSGAILDPANQLPLLWVFKNCASDANKYPNLCCG